jgi:hypothetical protein
MAKNFKDTIIQLSHMSFTTLWLEFDIACAIFCSLKFHVVSMHMYFLWRHHLPPDKMIKIVTLIDLYIILTYDCWHCFIVFNIWVSHALEMAIFFYHPTLELFGFHLPNLLLTQNFCLPNSFLFGGIDANRFNSSS